MAARVAASSTDREVVVRAQHGDVGAFEEIVEHRLARLFRMACGILGDPADAEDATQEACISAWQKLPTLRDVERLDAWLARILVNACRMRLRHKRKVREIALSETSTADVTDASRMADHAEEVDLVSRALDHVSVEDRALLLLHHVYNERVEAIAATLGMPAGTVKWRLSRARHAVQRALDGER